MAGRIGNLAGGTRSLLALIEEHSEAVEYELITHGLRLRWLGSEGFNWRDLLVIVRHSPESSALFRAIHGAESSAWDLKAHLLANMADTLNLLWWAKTEDATRKKNRPKPIPRPGVEDDSTKQIGSGSLPIEEMKAWLGGDFASLN